MTNSKEQKKCAKCGKVFEKPYTTSKKTWSVRRYCSTKCHYDNVRTRKIVNCKTCGSEFIAHVRSLKKGLSKFCSHSCTRSTDEKKKKTSLSMMGKNTWMKGRKNHHSDETKKKLSNRWKGKGNPNWTLVRADRVNRFSMPEYFQWRKQVLTRDRGCQLKDVECSGRLEAHHIKKWRDFPSLRFEASNGIILCSKHHDRTKFKEEKFEELFFGILNKKYSIVLTIS